METLFVGTNLLEFDCLPSTNNFLLDLSKFKKLPEGTLVWAKDQNSGRGQLGNTWKVCPNLNLTFSIILYPKFIPIAKQFAISKMIAVSLYEYLDRNFENVSIKWPNDIYIGNKKIAGILIENAIDQAGIKQSVIGIGLNVNQIDFPSDLPSATSSKIISGKDYDLRSELNSICKTIEKNYLKLKSDYKIMDCIYLDHLFRISEWKKYEDVKGKFEGLICGVDEHGKLLVKDREGVIRNYGMKELTYLNDL